MRKQDIGQLENLPPLGGLGHELTQGLLPKGDEFGGQVVLDDEGHGVVGDGKLVDGPEMGDGTPKLRIHHPGVFLALVKIQVVFHRFRLTVHPLDTFNLDPRKHGVLEQGFHVPAAVGTPVEVDIVNIGESFEGTGEIRGGQMVGETEEGGGGGGGGDGGDGGRPRRDGHWEYGLAGFLRGLQVHSWVEQLPLYIPMVLYRWWVPIDIYLYIIRIHPIVY